MILDIKQVTELEMPFVKVHPGECRRCGNPINVLVTEGYILELDKAGMSRTHNEVVFSYIGYCPICNMFVDVEANDNGIGFHITNNGMAKTKVSRSFESDLLPITEDNPFSIEKKDLND